MKRRLVTLCAMISFCIFAFLPNSSSAAGNVPQKVLDLRNSVVRVICQTSETAYTGSGFAIGKDEPIRYIVTNHHVVEKNPSGVTILRANNQQIAAKVYLQSANVDLCVLMLDEPLYNIPPVELYDENIADAGTAIYALGFPSAADVLSDTWAGNAEDVTITDGIVSAIKSATITTGGTPVRMVQIDAAINHGNSGGPLVDEDGQVLGINTLGAVNAQNINGAVSVLELVDMLKSNGVAYLSAAGTGVNGAIYYIIAGAAVLLIIGLAILLIVLAKRKAGKKEKASSFLEYIRQWGMRLPYDTAIFVLYTAIGQLATLHAQGRCHADVCPDALFVKDNRAFLTQPEESGSRKVILRPGYSAPEQYRADGRVGPWSDVYSVCAVIYATVTGSPPPGVLERQTLGEGLRFDGANIDEAHAAAVLAGLSIDAAQRPQNCADLLAALGLPITYGSPTASVPVLVESVPLKNAKKKKSLKKRILITAASVFLALCLGAGGYYFYTDSMYNQAVACIGRQDYEDGMKKLNQVLSFYKDSGKWMTYACACNDIQLHQYDQARKLFTGLGDFNHAGDMIRETDYQEALYLLANGKYQQAREALVALGDYKDSKQMITETDYQKALGELNAGDFQSAMNDFDPLAKNRYKDSESALLEAKYGYAIDLYNEKSFLLAFNMFNSFGSYKDSASYLDLVKKGLYEEAVSLYRTKKYDTAEPYFSKLGNYLYSFDYSTLIVAHTTFGYGVSENDATARKIYKYLMSMGDFEDAQDLCTTFYMYFRLEGKWKDGGGYFLEMNYEDGYWYLTCNVPRKDGDYYDVKNCIISYGSDKKGWKEAYKISFVSENEMKLYCIKNKQYYYLYR